MIIDAAIMALLGSMGGLGGLVSMLYVVCAVQEKMVMCHDRYSSLSISSIRSNHAPLFPFPTLQRSPRIIHHVLLVPPQISLTLRHRPIFAVIHKTFLPWYALSSDSSPFSHLLLSFAST